MFFVGKITLATRKFRHMCKLYLSVYLYTSYVILVKDFQLALLKNFLYSIPFFLTSNEPQKNSGFMFFSYKNRSATLGEKPPPTHRVPVPNVTLGPRSWALDATEFGEGSILLHSGATFAQRMVVRTKKKTPRDGNLFGDIFSLLGFLFRIYLVLFFGVCVCVSFDERKQCRNVLSGVVEPPHKEQFGSFQWLENPTRENTAPGYQHLTF